MIRPILIGCLVVPLLEAAQTLETMYRTDGSAVHQAFEFVREDLQKSSAVIRDGRREIAYGTVISADGYILTKGSELESVKELSVIVDQGAFESVEKVAEDPAWDLVLLKVEASNLVPVRYGDEESAEQGIWVVANGATSRTRRRVQVGVIAAETREVFPKGGAVLGVALDDSKKGLRVKEVTKGSGAELAGLRRGDRLLRLDGKEITGLEDLLAKLAERRVGELVDVEVARGDEELHLEVELSGRADLFGEEKTRNDAMSGEYSERRTGFARVLQHDIIGNRHTMGGPVLNLDGECVGMNIARFSRCETYAIPAAELRRLADAMIDQARK